MKEMRSLRELTRTLDVDQRIRRICLIEDGERDYPRSVLSRFTTLFGAEKLRRTIDEKVVSLLIRNRVEEVDTVLDASFIKAWSIRHPRDGRIGLSDPDARGEERPGLRPRLQAPRIGGPREDPAPGRRRRARQREREEA